MRVGAVADVQSTCNRKIRSGELADKLRHIRCQMVALHLREGSEEQDFSVKIRLKIRSGEFQETADISTDQNTLHMTALQEGAWQVKEAG